MMWDLEDGDAFRQWRKEQFLSQGELALMLDVHVNTVQNWEHSRSRIPRIIQLALETITGQRERQVRSLRLAQERLAHQRRLKMIEQGLYDAHKIVRKPTRQPDLGTYPR